MKIIDGNNVYVQGRDLEVVLTTLPKDKLPETIVAIGNNDIRNQYVKISQEEAVNFINSLDFIMDYNCARSLSLTDTLSMNEQALIDLNKAFKLYEEALNLSDEDSISRAQERLSLSKYKVECLKELISSKRGQIRVLGIEPKKKKHFSFKRG